MASSEAEASFVPCWKEVSAVSGRGALLVGRIEPTTAVVFVPPAVRLSTSPDWDVPLSWKGWRVAWWLLARDELVIDKQRPTSLRAHRFAEIVQLILDYCPSQLQWVADRHRARIQVLVDTLTPDSSHTVPSGGEQRRLELVELVGDAEAAMVDHGDLLTDAWMSLLRRECLRVAPLAVEGRTDRKYQAVMARFGPRSSGCSLNP